jgi:DNA polymerase III sliding clamp (beta) subunit (PCNA family)
VSDHTNGPIVFDRAALAEALAVVGKVKPWQRAHRRQVIGRDDKPVWMNDIKPGLIRMEVAADHAVLSSTDLGMSIARHVPCRRGIGPAVTLRLPVVAFSNAVNKAAKGAQIAIQRDDGRTMLTAGRLRVEMLGEEEDLAPVRPDVDGAVLHLPVAHLAEGLRVSAPAVSDDKKQHFMNGVNLRDVSGAAVFTGRDLNRAHQLSDIGSLGGDIDVILPDALCGMLLSVLPEDREGDASIRIGGGHVQVAWAGTVVKSTLIDGQFPAVAQDDRWSGERTLIARADQLLADLDLVATVSDPKQRDIRLDLGDVCEASAFNRVGGPNAGAIALEAGFHGEPLAVGFQFPLVRDALRLFGTDEICWRLRGSHGPSIMTSVARPGVRASIAPCSLLGEHQRVLA